MKKILIIEDNPDIRENTAEILELGNYKALTAENGKIGVEIAQREKPDLIICDIMMPVLDGYGVLHLLSKSEETANIPFIFLTAKAERSDLRKGMEMGADDYITKPFDDSELLNAVESRLKKAEMLKKNFAKSLDGLNAFFEEARGLETLQKLSEEREVRQYRKKDYIYSEGGYPRGIFFISKGKVKTFKVNELSKELITGLYKEGDFFGYVALLEESTYTDTAMAMDNCEICTIPKDDFFALIYKSPDVSRKFIKLLSDNLAEREEQLLKLAYNSVRKRVAEALVALHDKYKKGDGSDYNVEISREDLASIVGTAPESAIRTLSDFKDENLVEIKGRTITLLSYEKLDKMKN